MSTSKAHTTPGPELARVAWRVSTRSSNGGGQCVEVGPLSDGTGRVAVRHGRHRDGTAFVYSRPEWGAFLAGVKRGDFDRAT